MRFFRLRRVTPSDFSWDLRAAPRWCLPGVHCPDCREIRAGIGEAYPSVDLSHLSDQRKFRARLEEDFNEFLHLRERLRPLVPEGALLEPGTALGPLVGRGRGSFPHMLFPVPWTLLMRREALEQLQDAGLRRLVGCRTELHMQDRAPTELVELELELRGRLHPDCLPPHRPAPCETCNMATIGFPQDPILDADWLPTDRDLFRLGDFSTVIIGTERFADTVRRLGLEEVEFQELPTR